MLGQGPLGSIILGSSGGAAALVPPQTDYADTVWANDELVHTASVVHAASEAVRVFEALRTIAPEGAVDGVTAVASCSASAFVAILEALAIGSAASSSLAATNAASDAMTLQAAAGIAYRLLGSDAITVGDSGLPRTASVLRVLDTLLATGVAGSVLQARHQLASALAAADVARIAQFEAIEDAMVIGELVAQQLRAYEHALESLVASDVATMRARFTVLVTDGAAAADDVITTARLLEMIEDGAVAIADLALEDSRYLAWVLNPGTRAAWTYLNYGFNSFAAFEGRHYGAKADGIYLLEGDSDDGEAIRARLRTGLLDLGSPAIKRIPAMYVMASRSGDLVVKVLITTPEGRDEAHWYRLAGSATAKHRQDRVDRLDKGLEAVEFEFELVNLAGADFDIDSLHVLPAITSRRV